MKKYIITKFEKYGESMAHAFITKSNKEAKSYFALFIAGVSGTFSLYKVKKDSSLKLVEKEV